MASAPASLKSQVGFQGSNKAGEGFPLPVCSGGLYLSRVTESGLASRATVTLKLE